MSPTLKDCIDPWKAAGSRQLVKGDLALELFSRLKEILLDDSSSVHAELEFEFNDAKLPQVTGHLTGRLTIQCQRCLESMELPVDRKIELAFVHLGTTDQDLFEIYDIHEVEDKSVCLVDVLEDELLLLIPQVPMHSDPECLIETEFGEIETEQPEERENPFAVLASLKKTDS